MIIYLEDVIIKVKIKKGLPINIISYKVFNKGEEAFDLESSIIFENRGSKYIGKDMDWFNGKTELFKENIDIILK